MYVFKRNDDASKDVFSGESLTDSGFTGINALVHLESKIPAFIEIGHDIQVRVVLERVPEFDDEAIHEWLTENRVSRGGSVH